MSRHPVEGVNQHPPNDISAIIPPGISMSNHMMTARLHKGPSALTYIWFYNQVRNHGPWDYKQLGGKYENFGNFHYGAVGTAAGISPGVLLRGAGVAQKFAGTNDPEWDSYEGPNSHWDDPKDQTWIRAGIDYAKRTGF